MKVLHLLQFLGIGGLEKVLLMLIKEQIQQGLQVDVIVYDYEQTWVEKYRQEGINVITDYQKKEGYDLDLLKYLNSLVKDYDIVHCHDLNPMLYMAPLKIINVFKKFPKLVQTTHGMEHMDEGVKYSLFEKFSATFANKVITVSSKLQETYTQKLKVSRKKVVNIDNGTFIPQRISSQEKDELKKSVCQEFNLDSNKPLFIYVARVFPLKDQKILVDTLKNMPVQLLIVGPSGNDDYFNSLIPSETVILTKGREDIPRLLSASDFYISASHHEGIPIAVLEAAAYRLPCLLSDIPGHKVLTSQTVNDICLFFKVQNTQSLKEKVLQILERDNEKMVNDMFELVKDHYSSFSMANKYLDLYKEL